ncbi:MAG TPA: transcription termination/antitermination protein NusG [Candidatus Dojkabacteria bacterium]|nr:transcription termination/antitermination protein NusG [Candidatus Dojkabacteria bacterium]
MEKVKEKVKTKTKTVKEKTATPSETKKEYKNHMWYIVTAYSGHEKKVANLIMQRVKANKLEDQISDVLVPTQNKIVIADRKKKTVEEKLFPGYVLIKMDMNDQTWHLIRNTEGITGFVGTTRKPIPLSPEEVKGTMAYMKVQQPSYQASFAVGDTVRITDGLWKDFVGTINDINDDKGQVIVLLSLFGRETPVTLDYLQVSKQL